MKTLGFTAKAAGATSLALLLTTSAFADYRHQDQTYRDGNRADRNRTQSQTQTQVQTQPSTTSPSSFNRDNRTTRDNTYNRDTRDNNYNRGQRDNSYNRDNNNYNRGQRDNNYNRDNRATARSYRENEHVALSGRITSFRPENNGYRVFLEGGTGFWVPDSYYRRHSRDWRIGVNISLGGIFRGGSIIVDDGAYYPYPSAAAYDGYMRGVVERVDYRRGIAFVRDDRSGRIIEADLRTDRYGRLNLDDIRPGDFIELSGGWVRGDIFAVERIDSVRDGRRY